MPGAVELCSTRQRQCHLVAETEHTMVVDDFRWGRVEVGEPRLKFAYQRTTIHLDRIAEVHYWSENFPPKWLAAHGQLVFVMDGQEGLVGADGTGDIGMVFSVEAHLQEGQSYSPLWGLDPRGHYGMIHMLTTLSDRIQRSALIYGHSMDAYRLLLDPDQRRELARLAIRTASQPRPHERYHTTRKSCVTETIRVLNKVLPRPRRIRLWTIPGVLHNLRISHPKWTPGLLIERGLAEHWKSWDESVRELRLPQPGGTEYVFDVLGLPGSGVPRGARALENALHTYIGRAQSFRSLEQDLAAVPAEARHRAALEGELEETRGELEQGLEAVTALTVADPAVTVPYLLGLERPETPQATALIRRLLEGVDEEIAAGRWQPEDEVAAQMAALRAATPSR